MVVCKIMDKDGIRKLAEDPRFTSGIYNYCDRWCERCVFTSRCMNYALSEQEHDNPEARDIHNQVFWDKLRGILSATLDMAREKAKEMGIPTKELERVIGEAKRVRKAKKR